MEIPSLTKDDPFPRNLHGMAYPCEGRDGYAWVYVPEPGRGRVSPEDAVLVPVPEVPKFGSRFRSAHLTADQPQTLDLLQKDSTNLTRALRDAGLDVSQNGLNFSLRQQTQDSGAGRNGGRSQSRGVMLTAVKSIDATQASAVYRAPADGRLDIKV